MITSHQKLKPGKAARAAKTLALLALGASPFLPARTHAADPYDKNLESRVEALERELNLMEGDSKGKNVQGTDVPTFIRASKNVQELVFSGEVRFRYEYDTAQQQAGVRNPINGSVNTPSSQTSRDRFRFRLFLDYKLDDNFFAGAAVQTALAADSGNTTISEGFDNYSLYLWRFFVGWHTKDDSLKFIVGKQPNPFYSETELLWDADISPIGITEQVKYVFSPQLELSLIGGQFSFYNNPQNAFYNPRVIPGTNTVNPNYVNGGDNNDNAYLTYQQLVATFKPTNQLTLTGAAGFLYYIGHGGTNSPGAVLPAGQLQVIGSGNGAGQAGNVLQNTAAFNSANATRNLDILSGDFDVKFNLLDRFKIKGYTEAAYNLRGGRRDGQEYGLFNNNSITDKIAFATGVTFGSDYTIKKKGDFVLLGEYRQVGLGSVDPNLNDSDFNISRLGFRGFKGAASYGFYPWLIGTVTYYECFNLGVDKNVNIGVDNLNTSRTVQVDLTVKF